MLKNLSRGAINSNKFKKNRLFAWNSAVILLTVLKTWLVSLRFDDRSTGAEPGCALVDSLVTQRATPGTSDLSAHSSETSETTPLLFCATNNNYHFCSYSCY